MIRFEFMVSNLFHDNPFLLSGQDLIDFFTYSIKFEFMVSKSFYDNRYLSCKTSIDFSFCMVQSEFKPIIYKRL